MKERDNKNSEDGYEDDVKKYTTVREKGEPTLAFVGASWSALIVGVGAYLVGLFNAGMELNEKGYYFAILMLGIYSAVSLQKVVRDKFEDIPVTSIYYGLSWVMLIMSMGLLTVGLYNAGSIVLSEKGFYAMSYVLSLFSVVAVQKNVRDAQEAKNNKL